MGDTNMKVFIGSSKEVSGTNGLLDRVGVIVEQCKITPKKWNDTPSPFKAGNYTLENLEILAEEVDAAIFICTADDKIWYRGEQQDKPRDNVILEHALFMGKLGRTKTIIVKCGDVKLPSDLDGVTYIDFSKGKEREGEANLKHTLENFVSYKSHITQNLKAEQSSEILQLKKINEEKDKRIEVLTNYCKKLTVSEEQYKNIIIIGPRLSGKSTIAKSWCKPSKSITEYNPSPIGFDTYYYKLHDYSSNSTKYHNINIDIEMEKKIVPTLKIYDYAGEDSLISDAVSKIGEIPDCTIIMVFDSDPKNFGNNIEYYNRAMIEKMNDIFTNKKIRASSVKNVFVVFNKIDLYANNENTFDSNLSKIKTEHEMCMLFIKSIFGIEMQTFITTSTITNHNITNLFRKIINSYGYK